MKAIVTGGAGFIGSHIAERLIKDGHDIIVIDDLSAGKESNIPKGAKYFGHDVSFWLQPFRDIDVIFHNAASKKNICLRDPGRDLDVNGAGTLMLLQWAKRTGVKKFIHASTGSVYGEVIGRITEQTCCNPVSYYGISKLAGENYVNHSDLDTTVLRYFHVYGPRQENDPHLGGVIAVFKKQMEEGNPITIHGTGEQERVFTHVNDVVEANIQAWLNPVSYKKVYNCCCVDSVTVQAMAYKLMTKYGQVDIKRAPNLEGDIFNFNVDNYRIKEDLGIRFTPFNKGIEMI